MSDGSTKAEADGGTPPGAAAATDNPCGNPYCTCGVSCTCGPGCRCGMPADEAGTTSSPKTSSASCACGDTCSCGAGCSCGSEARPTVLVVGAMVGLFVPIVVGLVQRQVGGSDDAGHLVHTSNGSMTQAPVLGDAAWFYGAMVLVLAAGFVHAVIRSRTNACGSTPLGMGIMWGAMAAMAVGMAAGVH